MGPCVTNWYFTSWPKAVSERRVKEVSRHARDQTWGSSAFLALSVRRSAAPACRRERWCVWLEAESRRVEEEEETALPKDLQR